MLDAVPEGDATPDAPTPASSDPGATEGAPEPAARRESFRIEGDDWDFLKGRGPEDVRRELDEYRNAQDMRRSAQEKYDEAARIRRQYDEAQARIRQAETFLDSLHGADPEEAAELIRKYQRTGRVPGEDSARGGDPEWRQEVNSLRQELEQAKSREAERLLDQQIDAELGRHTVFRGNEELADATRGALMKRIAEDTASGRLNYGNYKRELPRYVREQAQKLERALDRALAQRLQAKRDAEKNGIRSGKGPGGSPRTTPKQAQPKNGRPRSIDEWVTAMQAEANRILSG